LILRKNVEKRALYHHLENVFLAIDEIIDDGIIMEIDPNNVYNRLGKEPNKLSRGDLKIIIQLFDLKTFHSRRRISPNSLKEPRKKSSGASSSKRAVSTTSVPSIRIFCNKRYLFLLH
jgi:hypothetical protein